MKILAVDDEKYQLSRLTNAIREARPDDDIIGFQSPVEALEWATNNKPDVAFLDIEMPGISGTKLARQLKAKYPDANIIFATAFADYATEAFDIHASGYVLKPVKAERIAEELRNLRYEKMNPETGDKLKIVCFGNFEALWQGRPLTFKRSKTLEFLAFLVDRRGAHVNVNEICVALWDDFVYEEKHKSHLRHLISDLSNTLEEIGQSRIFIKQRNSYAIDPSAIECDYYDYLAGEPSAVQAFNGEYMSRYSWAELTLGWLIAKEE